MSRKQESPPPGNRTKTGRFAKGASGNPATRFQPGQSGNPEGRPKSLAANIRAKVGDDGEALVQQLLAIARRRGSAWGRVQAIKELLDRGWGKSPQAISVTAVPTIRTPDVDLLKRIATVEEMRVMRDVMRRALAIQHADEAARLSGGPEPNGD